MQWNGIETTLRSTNETRLLTNPAKKRKTSLLLKLHGASARTTNALTLPLLLLLLLRSVVAIARGFILFLLFSPVFRPACQTQLRHVVHIVSPCIDLRFSGRYTTIAQKYTDGYLGSRRKTHPPNDVFFPRFRSRSRAAFSLTSSARMKRNKIDVSKNLKAKRNGRFGYHRGMGRQGRVRFTS